MTPPRCAFGGMAVAPCDQPATAIYKRRPMCEGHAAMLEAATPAPRAIPKVVLPRLPHRMARKTRRPTP